MPFAVRRLSFFRFSALPLFCRFSALSIAFILFAIRHDTCERLNAMQAAASQSQRQRQRQRQSQSARALCVCLVAFKVHRKLISFRFVSISQKTSMEFSLHVFAFLSAPTPHTYPHCPPPVIVVIIIVVAYNVSNNNITSSPAVVVAVVASKHFPMALPMHN